MRGARLPLAGYERKLFPTIGVTCPKCTDGNLCRYKAENDTYTCEAPPTTLRSQGQSLGRHAASRLRRFQGSDCPANKPR